MQSGKLRHKIIFQTPSETTSDTGEATITWVNFAPARAKITPLNGKEYFAAAQTQATVTHKINTRFISGITTKMQIVFNNRKFNILGAPNLNERSRELEILAVENV